MNVTEAQRRDILKLFNVAETSRILGIAQERLYRDIRAGRVRSPQIPLGKRVYFRSEDLTALREHYEKEIER